MRYTSMWCRKSLAKKLKENDDTVLCRYATMLVRQLMKGSTSVSAHKKMTAAAAAAECGGAVAVDAIGSV